MRREEDDKELPDTADLPEPRRAENDSDGGCGTGAGDHSDPESLQTVDFLIGLAGVIGALESYRGANPRADTISRGMLYWLRVCWAMCGLGERARKKLRIYAARRVGGARLRNARPHGRGVVYIKLAARRQSRRTSRARRWHPQNYDERDDDGRHDPIGRRRRRHDGDPDHREQPSRTKGRHGTRRAPSRRRSRRTARRHQSDSAPPRDNGSNHGAVGDIGSGGEGGIWAADGRGNRSRRVRARPASHSDGRRREATRTRLSRPWRMIGMMAAMASTLSLAPHGRVGEASHPGPDRPAIVATAAAAEDQEHRHAGHHDEGLRIVTGNGTGWGTLREWLGDCAYGVICMQEHKLVHPEDVAAASTDARRKGWKSFWSAAIPSKHEAEAPSAGVAVMVRAEYGALDPLGGSDVAPGRCAAALVEAGGIGGLVAYSVYLECGTELGAENWRTLSRIAQHAKADGRPWIMGGRLERHLRGHGGERLARPDRGHHRHPPSVTYHHQRGQGGTAHRLLHCR